MEALQVCSMAGETICSVPYKVFYCEGKGVMRWYFEGSCDQTVRALRAHVARVMGCDVGNIALTLDSRVLTDGEPLQQCLDQHGSASQHLVCIHQSTFDQIDGNWLQVEPPREKARVFSIVDGCITTSDGVQEVIQEIDDLTVKIQRGQACYDEAFEGKLVDGKLVWTFVSSTRGPVQDKNGTLFTRWVMEREVVEEVTMAQCSDLNVVGPRAYRRKRNRDTERVCSCVVEVRSICSEGHNAFYKNTRMSDEIADSNDDYEECAHEAQAETSGFFANVMEDAYINVKSRSLLRQENRQHAKRRPVRSALVQELPLPKTAVVCERVLEKAAKQQRWARQDRGNHKKRHAQRAFKVHMQSTASPCKSV